MRAGTLSALVLGLALPLLGQTVPASEPLLLVGIFQALLTPEQAAKLEEPPTPEAIAALLDARQKASAKRVLAQRAAATRDPEELAELARGCQLLGDPQGMVEIGARLVAEHPGNSRGYSLAADGFLKQGKDDTALQLVNQALARDPSDKRARGLKVLIESRRNYAGGSGSAAPANKPIEAAMIGLPQGAAYKAAVSMAGKPPQDSALAVGMDKALRQLKPTAASVVPLDLAPEHEPPSEGPAKTPLGAVAAAATAAAVTVGSVLLFLGLLPKRLDQDYPWLKPSMTGGMLLAGAFMSYDFATSHFLYGRYVAWKLNWGKAAAAAVPAVPKAAERVAAIPTSFLGARRATEAAGVKPPPMLFKGGTNQTVLGSWPTYLTTAEKMKGQALNMPPEVWEKMSQAERWAANKRFLDKAIYRGDQFFLATDPFFAEPASWYAKELQYLLANGYVLNDAGNKLIKAK